MDALYPFLAASVTVDVMEDVYPFLVFGIFIFIFFRIRLFRPHWLGNCMTFIVMMVFFIIIGSGELTGDAALGLAFFSVLFTWFIHGRAKKHDKKKGVTPKSNQPSKPSGYPQPTPKPQPTPVKQTLTTCVRCGKPLQGPKCKHCAFDHTADAIFLLCRIEPENLQINIHHNNTSN